MKVNPDVNAQGVAPALWLYLGTIAREHRGWTGQPLTITSLRRKPGPRPSKHSPLPGQLCAAADIRRWTLDEAKAAGLFARMLREKYGAELGVVLEPEELTPEQVEERGGIGKIGPHLHVQLKVDGWPGLV